MNKLILASLFLASSFTMADNAQVRLKGEVKPKCNVELTGDNTNEAFFNFEERVLESFTRIEVACNSPYGSQLKVSSDYLVNTNATELGADSKVPYTTFVKVGDKTASAYSPSGEDAIISFNASDILSKTNGIIKYTVNETDVPSYAGLYSDTVEIIITPLTSA